jgi:hypothetical protein
MHECSDYKGINQSTRLFYSHTTSVSQSFPLDVGLAPVSMGRSLFQVGIVDLARRQVVKLVCPCAIVTDQQREVDEVKEVKTDQRPSESHRSLSLSADASSL